MRCSECAYWQDQNTSDTNAIYQGFKIGACTNMPLLRPQTKPFNTVKNITHFLFQNDPSIFYTPEYFRCNEFRSALLGGIVDSLLPRFNGMEEHFKGSVESFTSFCQSQLSGGIAMKIRNELKLWDSVSPINKYIHKYYENIHPDKISDIILVSVYHKWHEIHNPEYRRSINT